MTKPAVRPPAPLNRSIMRITDVSPSLLKLSVSAFSFKPVPVVVADVAIGDQVVGRRFAAFGVRFDVVEFQVFGSGAVPLLLIPAAFPTFVSVTEQNFASQRIGNAAIVFRRLAVLFQNIHAVLKIGAAGILG